MTFILNITVIIAVQLMLYLLFLRPKILKWGTTKAETEMSMIGDEMAPTISATRAISIDAAKSTVWHWLIQLGADRGGFFSYAFIESVLGYEKREGELKLEFNDLEVGRIIPGSIDESKSVIKFNFPVVAVEPERAFVLEEWGTFLLQVIEPEQTRLIVRTHGTKPDRLLDKVIDLFGVFAHYIMERRMLLGFKSCAETGHQLSAATDNLWLFGIFAAAIGWFVMAFMGATSLHLMLATAFAMMWLWVLLIPKPDFKMSNLLLLAEVVTLIWLF